MIHAASIQNFETGDPSGLQSRRLTDYYITKEGDICPSRIVAKAGEVWGDRGAAGGKP
jgi:hypothetical protein